jgi:hypothetical protein
VTRICVLSAALALWLWSAEQAARAHRPAKAGTRGRRRCTFVTFHYQWVAMGHQHHLALLVHVPPAR